VPFLLWDKYISQFVEELAITYESLQKVSFLIDATRREFALIEAAHAGDAAAAHALLDHLRDRGEDGPCKVAGRLPSRGSD
jgi:DNA polymerase III delta subunit